MGQPKAPSTTFGRITRGMGGIFAYTTGDLTSNLRGFSSEMWKYIPYSSNSSASKDVLSISSFQNLSQESLVASGTSTSDLATALGPASIEHAGSPSYNDKNQEDSRDKEVLASKPRLLSRLRLPRFRSGLGFLFTKVKSFYRRIRRKQEAIAEVESEYGLLPESTGSRKGFIARFMSLFRWRGRNGPTNKEASKLKDTKDDGEVKEGLFTRAVNRVALVLRRRILWAKKSSATWMKSSSSVGMITSRRRGEVMPAPPPPAVKKGPLKSVRSFAMRRLPSKLISDDEFIDGERVDMDIPSNQLKLFQNNRTERRFPDLPSSLPSASSPASRGFSGSQWSDLTSSSSSSSPSDGRFSGLFSDGKNIMAISVQMLSGVTEASLGGININRMSDASGAFLRGLLSTTTIFARGNNRATATEELPPPEQSPMNTDQSNVKKEESTDDTIFEYGDTPGIELAAKNSNAFSPLIHAVQRTLFGVAKTSPPLNSEAVAVPAVTAGKYNSVLDVVPLVRLLPRVRTLFADEGGGGTGLVRRPSETRERRRKKEGPSANERTISRRDEGIMRTLYPLVGTTVSAESSSASFPRASASSFPPSSSSLAPPDMYLQPSDADMALVKTIRVVSAVRAATKVRSRQDFQTYMSYAGLRPLLAVLVRPPTSRKELRVDAAYALRTLINYDATLISAILSKSSRLDALNEMMEEPLQGFSYFRSQADRKEKMRAQVEALSLLCRMLRSSDEAVNQVRKNQRTMQLLAQIRATGEGIPDSLNTLTAADLSRVIPSKPRQIKPSTNLTTIVDYDNWKPYEMVVFYF